MGSKYPVLKPSEVIRVLTKLGFVFKSQKGSHAKYVKISTDMATRTVIIPIHSEVAKGTLQNILEQAGVSLRVCPLSKIPIIDFTIKRAYNTVKTKRGRKRENLTLAI